MGTRRRQTFAAGILCIALGTTGLWTAPWLPTAPVFMNGTIGPGMMRAMPHGMMWGGPWATPQTAAVPDSTSASPSTEGIPPGAVVVELRAMRFEPQQVTVASGTTIVFVNRDAYPHRVVQSSITDLGLKAAGFVSPVLTQGQRWSFTFAAAGTFSILCDVGGHHLAGMVGQVSVG